ncbi:MAG TPA: hypothetical protein VFH55_09460 [Nitrospiria bacterium]|nr:hypothetical protein [Nitrospiria bacterium]
MLAGATACASRTIRIPDAMPTHASLDASTVATGAKKLDAEVIDQSWHPATFSWPKFDRGMFFWTTTVKNNAPQSRDICVVFHLFNAKHRPLLGERGCRVVAPGKEGHISSSAFVDLDLLKHAKSGQALPYESHTIYYPKATTG